MPTPFSAIKNISIDIQWWGHVEWQPKFFCHHPRDRHCPMVIEYFQLSRKGVCHMFLKALNKQTNTHTHPPPPFFGARKVLVAIKKGD